MASSNRIAVVGATGAVGQTVLQILEQRNFPVGELRALASARSAGKTVTFKGEKIPVEVLSEDSFKGIDFAFFSAGSYQSKKYAPHAVKAGAIVIDKSSAFRMMSVASLETSLPNNNTADAFPANDRWAGCVSVIVPVYNEVAHVDELLQAIHASPVKKEVIIVDDGSTDGTREKLQAMPLPDNVTVIFHQSNCGKGAAIRTALHYARGEYILIQDSDLEYDPEDYSALLRPIEQREAVARGQVALELRRRREFLTGSCAERVNRNLQAIFC